MSGSSDGKSMISGWLADFKQQKISAFVPRYTATSISPLFIAFGILLIPVGISVLVISSDGKSDTKEIRIDYTECRDVNGRSCADFIRTPENWSGGGPCECEVKFELEKTMKGKKLYLYYSLSNFHQNVRQYANSRDNSQLKGDISIDISKDCKYPFNGTNDKVYLPCGAVANSMFNDTIQLYYVDGSDRQIKIQQGNRGIAWESDKKYRFKNPPEFENRNHPMWENFTKPKDWSRTIWDLDPDHPENNGFQNEDFIVWMRTAAFSNFQKLYRIIRPADHGWENELPAGNYLLRINYTYEVKSFAGKKGVVLASTTVFGIQNYFQGISTISIGGISLILGLLLLLCGCTNRLGRGSISKNDLHEL